MLSQLQRGGEVRRAVEPGGAGDFQGTENFFESQGGQIEQGDVGVEGIDVGCVFIVAKVELAVSDGEADGAREEHSTGDAVVHRDEGAASLLHDGVSDGIAVGFEEAVVVVVMDLAVIEAPACDE